MADKSDQLILSALSAAAAHADGLPLHGSKAAPGLFPATAVGKQAAERCRQDGYLTILNPAPAVEDGKKRKPAPERCVLTEKGVAWLLRQLSPREVIEGLVRAVEGSQAQVGALLEVVQQMQRTLYLLGNNVQSALSALPTECPATEPGAPGSLAALFRQFLTQRPTDSAPPSANGHAETAHANGDTASAHPAGDAIVSVLQGWEASGAPDDCPLPDLLRRTRETVRGLTVGAFHDELRRLYSCGRIALHPWPGPLYEIPDPQVALLIGHAVAYYASIR